MSCRPRLVSAPWPGVARRPARPVRTRAARCRTVGTTAACRAGAYWVNGTDHRDNPRRDPRHLAGRHGCGRDPHHIQDVPHRRADRDGCLHRRLARGQALSARLARRHPPGPCSGLDERRRLRPCPGPRRSELQQLADLNAAVGRQPVRPLKGSVHVGEIHDVEGLDLPHAFGERPALHRRLDRRGRQADPCNRGGSPPVKQELWRVTAGIPVPQGGEQSMAIRSR